MMEPPKIASRNDKPLVAIIGAGLAGLSAAVHLHGLGFRPLLLEAQSSPGGRVRSATLPSSPAAPHRPGRSVELGATFFHGTHGNAAYELSVASGLHVPGNPDENKEEEVGYELFSAEGKFVGRDGTITSVAGHSGSLLARQYAKALEQLTIRPGTCEIGIEESVRNFVRQQSFYAQLDPKNKSMLRSRDLLEAAINGCGDSTAGLSASLFGEYETLPGPNLSAPKEGMYAIVDALIARLPDETCIRCNAEVTAVHYGEGAKPGVRVQLSDGTWIHASCAIWTPSLNVTKAACEDGVFSPPLPREKMAALSSRGQGTVEKVFAVLESPLRGVDPGRDTPIYWELKDGETEDEEATAEEGKSAATTGCKQAESRFAEWCRGVYALSYDASSACVEWWLCGRYGATLSAREEEGARAEVCELLSAVYGQAVGVRAVVRSSWGANRFTRGSYSYPRAGGDADAVRQAARPLPGDDLPVLCFAGEGTHAGFYSTMHGAVETGRREAERCAAFLGGGGG